jgi:hypothetical protein
LAFSYGGDNVPESDMVDLKAIVTILEEKDKLVENPLSNVPTESIIEALSVLENPHNDMI